MDSFQFSLWDSLRPDQVSSQRLYNFQFSLWDSSRCFKLTTSADFFQFSLWDSATKACLVLVPFDSFQFSLWDSQQMRIQELTYFTSFNSLCEILSQHNLMMHFYQSLSILFVRFIMLIGGDAIYPKWLSILFVRFLFVLALLYHLHLPFNSLCEILGTFTIFSPPHATFNSLCEIL